MRIAAFDQVSTVLPETEERRSTVVCALPQRPTSARVWRILEREPDRRNLPVPAPYPAGGPNPRRFSELRGMPHVQPNALLAHSRCSLDLLTIARSPTGRRLPGR